VEYLSDFAGIKFYPNPKDRQLSLLTKERCILHDEQINPRDFQSTTKMTITVPQNHPEYLTAKKSSVGPRRAMLEANMKASVEADFKMKAASDHTENRRVFYESINSSTFNRPGFKPSLVERDLGNRVPTVNTDYSTDPAITYYSDKVKNGTSVNFPVTYTNVLRNPFLKSSAFSADVRNGVERRCESNERPKPALKLKEYRDLAAFRKRLIREITIPDKSLGAVVRNVVGFVSTTMYNFATDFVDVEDVAAGFQDDFGFTVTNAEKNALVIAYSVDDTNRISLPDFSNLIRGTLSPRQVELISIVFNQMDASCGSYGRVTEDAIAARYRAPRTTESLASFLNALGFPTDNDGAAVLEDFVDYYAAVLAELGDDADAFEALLRSTWGI
jgi:hypothetical protein